MERMTIVFAVAVGLLFAGCGKSKVSEEEAQEGWAATQQTLMTGQAQAEGEVSAQTNSNADGSAGEATVDVTCIGGGTATLDATYEVLDDSSSSTTKVEAAFTAKYNGCTHNGITIDGNLDFDVTTKTDNDSASLVYGYNGNLDYSGDVTGSCKIDMRGSVNAGGGTGSYSYSGSICGHDADSTLNSRGSFSYDVPY